MKAKFTKARMAWIINKRLKKIVRSDQLPYQVDWTQLDAHSLLEVQRLLADIRGRLTRQTKIYSPPAVSEVHGGESFL